MTLWLRRSQGMGSKTMRDIAETAAVSWDYQTIVYQAKGIGYADGDPIDKTAIQDAAENLLGYRPQPYDPPVQDDTS